MRAAHNLRKKERITATVIFNVEVQPIETEYQSPTHKDQHTMLHLVPRSVVSVGHISL